MVGGRGGPDPGEMHVGGRPDVRDGWRRNVCRTFEDPADAHEHLLCHGL